MGNQTVAVSLSHRCTEC